MRILILNWRDIKNPEHGGAEILTHEMAKRWVAWGHTVTQFSSLFKEGAENELIDGVRVIRSGSSMIRSFHIPVHLAAYFWYRAHSREFDVVIDEIHGIPFFSTLYVRQPVVALICEVAGDLWDIAFSFPINRIGSLVERFYFRFYKNVPFLTISPSTKKELVAMNVSKKHITILPMGVTIPRIRRRVQKERAPTLIYVGRLTRAKGIEDAIKVVSLVQAVIPTIRLLVIGQGDDQYTNTVRDSVEKDGLSGRVQFLGYVTEEMKFDALARAYLLITPSYKEGWGLTVHEAANVGTPTVAYDVDGLRDSVKQAGTGILTSPNPGAMANEVIRVMRDTKLYEKLQNNVSTQRKNPWEQAAKEALRVLSQAL